jgi:hypothetical protein
LATDGPNGVGCPDLALLAEIFAEQLAGLPGVTEELLA